MWVSLKIGDVSIKVKGRYIEPEPKVGLDETFIIHEILCDNDVTDLLVWANNCKKGTVLQFIEEKILEFLNNQV